MYLECVDYNKQGALRGKKSQVHNNAIWKLKKQETRELMIKEKT